MSCLAGFAIETSLVIVYAFEIFQCYIVQKIQPRAILFGIDHPETGFV